MAVNGSTTVVAAMVGATFALAAQTGPKLPYETWGACPFECCTYRAWTVKVDTDILSERREGAPKRFAVARGARVVGVTGVVVTTKVGLAVVERETTIGQARITVQPGEEILLLHYIGEGFWKYWLRGKIDEEFIPDPDNCKRSAQRSPTMFAQCGVQEKERPETVWWVKIRNRDGREGWTRQVDHFGNIDACGVSEAGESKPHNNAQQPSAGALPAPKKPSERGRG
jgi:hypothetical protein